MSALLKSSIAVFLRTALGIALVCLAMMPGTAFAQAPAAPTGPLHSDAMPYLLILFCLALGLIIVCRSANRSPDVRLEDLDEL